MKTHSIYSLLLDLFLNSSSQCNFTLFFLFIVMLLLLGFFSSFYIQNPSLHKVYMLDFACFKAPSSLMISKARFIEMYKLLNESWDAESVDFLKHIMDKAGLGDSTYLSEAHLRIPPNPSMEASKKEAEMVMFGAIDELFAKTNNKDVFLKSKENIGILIVNCSIFNVVPCLASMIVNRYKLREDIASYNVTGMGCSAGLLAIGLAKNLLQGRVKVGINYVTQPSIHVIEPVNYRLVRGLVGQVHRNKYALVVSTEIVSEQVYIGKDKSKLATNCLFRLGGSAVLLSNLSSDRKSSKYELLHNVHVNNSKSDISYTSIFLEEDTDGILGITINKDLLIAAKSAIESNISILGRQILPWSEKIRFLTSLFVRSYMASRLKTSDKECTLRNRNVPKRYVPKFNRCVEHFFPHVGGKPVLDELQKILRFNDSNMEASRMTLYRFGNTSSSSIWYELAYSEAKGRIKKGDRLWQMAFGTGFKCSSLVWRALKSIENEEMNPWSGEIDQFRVNLDEIGTLDSKLYYFEPTN